MMRVIRLMMRFTWDYAREFTRWAKRGELEGGLGEQVDELLAGMNLQLAVDVLHVAAHGVL